MEEEITGLMTQLVLQIGVIIFSVRFLGKLTEKIGIPSVIGELLAGVIIGPYALGAIPLPGFPNGLFPVHSLNLAVTPELYGFAMLASVILLFSSGLETDLGLFIRYSVAGGGIGISGVVFSFLFGDITAMLLLNAGFMDLRCLFFGIMSTATSVGITARILSDRRKMNTPEGVTIIAAAVFDDVLGIILLAVVMGIAAVVNGKAGHTISTGAIVGIAARAFGIWLGFTALGLIFSKKIAWLLKRFKNSYDFSICSLGIALILAGFFEKQGMAMIIGAYIAGLSLSNTDIAAVIHENIVGLYDFFVPIFFAVMGMMVNVSKLCSRDILIFGGIYTLTCILSKVIGCGIPAMFLGFNLHGALRIGSGMVPRGEVALIIAGIGLTSGILDEQLFGVIIMMTLMTTIVAPPLLNFFLNMAAMGTKKTQKTSDTVSYSWDFKSDEIAGLVNYMFLKTLKNDGFFITSIDDEISTARMNKNFLTIKENGAHITVEAAVDNLCLAKTAMYEVMLKFIDSERPANKTVFQEVKQNIAHGDNKIDVSVLRGRLSENTISLELHGDTKEDVLKEMVLVMCNSGVVCNWRQLLADINMRENMMSTGMEMGVAFPHARSSGVNDLCVAIGVKKEGVDFKSIDGEPARIFVLIVAPKDSSVPHLQVLSTLSGILRDADIRKKILAAEHADEILGAFRDFNIR
ncbi:MAG: cation:proton antiporter [Spirochaetia bacterium]|nr:cation:proton antiporter [Spirochaetia bacterium]